MLVNLFFHRRNNFSDKYQKFGNVSSKNKICHTALDWKNLNNVGLKGALTILGPSLVVAECQLRHIICKDTQEKKESYLILYELANPVPSTQDVVCLQLNYPTAFSTTWHCSYWCSRPVASVKQSTRGVTSTTVPSGPFSLSTSCTLLNRLAINTVGNQYNTPNFHKSETQLLWARQMSL